MRKKIAILGSTGTIGKNLLNLISKNLINYDVVLLTAESNSKSLISQANKFKVKNLIISNEKKYEQLKYKSKNLNFKIYKNFNSLETIFKNKIDYVMSAITGIDGLKPTLKIIKHTKKIAIANKESIICGWDLIGKELKKNNTQFVPVDSEHFSIWQSIKNNNDVIDKLILTASGGPFLNFPLKNFKKIKINQALNHPNWKMGKKISIDSATMVNKVFEIIEAKNLFNVNYKDISILSHPKSYVHSIIKFKNGIIKIVAHDTDMKIPIFNSLCSSKDKIILKTSKINIEKLNTLNLKKIDKERFPSISILKKLPNKASLFETILVSANDALVEMFLNGKISYLDISKKLIKFMNNKKIKKFKKQKPKNVEEILNLNKYVRLKILSKSI